MKTIAIIFGGYSDEYDISLQSAHAVITHLPRDKYLAVPVGITCDGRWLHYTGDPALIPDDRWHTDAAHCAPVALPLDRGAPRLLKFTQGGITPIPLDAVFPVLHGKNGEDGTVQGLCELCGIPLIGCGMAASAIGMDKHCAHILAAQAGVDVPRAVVITRAQRDDNLRVLTATLPDSVFVKPVRSGSSLGVTRVDTRDALAAAVSIALQYDDKVIIEEAIDGFEVGCAVLGRDELMIGAPDEIELHGDLFDFTEKYTLKTARIHCPARIDDDTAQRVKEAAAAVYRALGCAVLARVDLFITPQGRIVFNEVNTIPGFTSHSRYPSMMAEIGLPFPALLDRLITCGLSREVTV